MKIELGWRIWVLIIALFISIFSIFGFSLNFLQEGVLITGVDADSKALQEGLKKNDIIINIDGKEIKKLDDYTQAMQDKFSGNESVKTTIQTTSSEFI